MTLNRSTKCAIFWDIENVSVPKGTMPTYFVEKIRRLISDNSWMETNFTIVCNVITLCRDSLLKHLDENNVTIIHVPSKKKNAADEKIKDLMIRFVENAGDSNVSIILLTGDGDFASISSTLKHRNNVTIYLIHNDNVAKCLIKSVDKAIHFEVFANPEPTYMKLKPYKSPFCEDPWLVRVTGHPKDVKNAEIVSYFRKLTQEWNGKFIENERGVAIWLSFKSKSDATVIANAYNRQSYRGHTLTTSIVKSKSIKNRVELEGIVEPTSASYAKIDWENYDAYDWETDEEDDLSLDSLSLYNLDRNAGSQEELDQSNYCSLS